ncbi:DUF3189 family protein [Sporosarcina globispora]|nr:DUF3189 family protein [Sporosarcina globispora]
MMKVIYIYHDFGGTHTTSLAAAYHLKIIQHRKLKKEEIVELPYFNKLTKKDAGKFIFHGADEEGNLVYTLGRRSSKLAMETLRNFCHLLNSHKGMNDKIVFSNTSPAVPLALTIGGFISKGLGLDRLGTSLVIIGAQKCSGNILELVNETKKIAAGSNADIIKIDNKEFQA